MLEVDIKLKSYSEQTLVHNLFNQFEKVNYLPLLSFLSFAQLDFNVTNIYGEKINTYVYPETGQFGPLKPIEHPYLKPVVNNAN